MIIQSASKTIMLGDNGYQTAWLRSDRTYPMQQGGNASGGGGISTIWGWSLSTIGMGQGWGNSPIPYPPEKRRRALGPSGITWTAPCNGGTSGAWCNLPEPRHDGQANFLFMDGHVTSMSENEIVSSWPGLWSLSKSAEQLGVH